MKKAFTLAEVLVGRGAMLPVFSKAGFTLAEVLITLGIIGVIAAITISGLINNYKAHRLHSQFLKSYSTVQQVFKQMESDDVSLDPSTYAGYSFYKVFMRYLTGAKDCGIGDQSTPCYYARGDNPNKYKTLHRADIVWRGDNYFDDGQILLSDGTLILFNNRFLVSTVPMETDGKIFISVDLNGYVNPPNIWGYDLFTFEFLDGELRTMGDRETFHKNLDRYCNINSTDGLNGVACEHKAKTDSDYFKTVVKIFK